MTTALGSHTNGRTARADARDERTAHDSEELEFVQRTVEDAARIWYAASRDLAGPAEQMAARLLVVAQRRHRQLTGEEVDLSRWGVR